MLVISDILVSNDIVEEQFVCNLNACKGACCWEGDWGAPLEAAELLLLGEIYDQIEPYLNPEGKAVLQEEGLFTYYEEAKEYGTPLLKNGACAYLVYDELGIAKCGIEQAYLDGATDFKKPISCHLYPIRVDENKETGFEALNYDKWDICSAACQLGKKEQVPVYKFVKEALIRKYGEDFYRELDAAAAYLRK
ncbi:MAG: DUF3109 family protein [Saprospiraceae bacterium]